MNIDRLREAFAFSDFSIGEASLTLGITMASTRSILRDLRFSGVIERSGRGKYHLTTESRIRSVRRGRSRLIFEEALRAPYHVVLDGPDAVALWTEGRYRVGEDHRGPALHVAVTMGDLASYELYLDELGIRHVRNLEVPERRGPYVVIRPVAAFNGAILDGRPVLSLEETLDLIGSAPIAFDGAEELID